jgi:TPR repeat protein
MLATMVEDGRGIAKNPARAKALRAKADALDVTQRTAASAQSTGAAAAAGRDPAADEEACRRAHDVERCESAGAAAQDTDVVKAEELFRLGCSSTGNKGAACGLYGFAIDRLRRDDPSRAIRLLQQGCQEGAVRSCTILAEVQHLGFRSPRAEVNAADTYQKACDLGDPFACRTVASRFRAAKNNAKADELRDRGVKMETDPSASLEKWARESAERRARGPHAQELAKARTELAGIAQKARSREAARTRRLESAYAGRNAAGAPPFTKEEIDLAATREAAIKKATTPLFQVLPRPASAPK